MEQKQLPYHAIWAVLLVALVVFGYFLFASGRQTALPDSVVVKTPSHNGTALVVPGATHANITLIGISDTRCPQCRDDISIIKGIVDSAASMNFTIEGALELNQTDPRAQALMEQYNITRLPTVLVNREAQANPSFVSTWLSYIGSKEPDGTFVMRTGSPPFVENDSVIGIVNLTLVRDPQCTDCIDPATFIGSLTLDNQYHVSLGKVREFNISSEEGSSLISRYAITKIPAVIFPPDIEWYPAAMALFNLTQPEADGSYVYRDVYPPYYNLATGTVEGLVDVIAVSDPDCPECYAPRNIIDTLEEPSNGYLLVVGTYRQINVTSDEGRALMEKYHFDFIPTVVLSPQAGKYSAFQKRLGSFGTQEPDGWFVFRNKKALGNLTVRMMPQ